MADITDIRIHRTSLGDAVSINGSWVNLADHAELSRVVMRLTIAAHELRRSHEDASD